MIRVGMIAAFLLLALPAAAPAVTFTVNSNNTATDGTCNVGHCSLREAIDAANATMVIDEIDFDDDHVIVQTYELPQLTAPVTINASTAPDCAGARENVELDGNGGNYHGLRFAAGSDGSTLCDLTVRGFGQDGVRVSAPDVTVQYNRIGTDVTGELDDGNGGDGVHVFDGGDGATIDGNLISGNTIGVELDTGATGGVVTSNYVGLDDDGARGDPQRRRRDRPGERGRDDRRRHRRSTANVDQRQHDQRPEPSAVRPRSSATRSARTASAQTDLGNGSGIIVTGGD